MSAPTAEEMMGRRLQQVCTCWGGSERVLLVPQQAALHAQQCNECDCAALRRVSTGHRPHLQLQKVASKFA